jgi:hypothetical protein
MTSDLDPNKIVAEFVQQNLDRAVEVGSGKLEGVKNFVRSKFAATYQTYLERTLARYSRAKSFFIRSEPVPLYDFFVPLDLYTQKRQLKSPEVADIVRVSRLAIITGSGGSGKSMMMRHILISALRDRQRTPVFFEMRQLNTREGTLREALLRTLQTGGLSVDSSYFDLALRAGHFVFLLDGYDELEQRLRRDVARWIQDLATEHPGNWIILSSRPDKELEGWPDFTVFGVSPLNVDKATALVSRLTFDDEVKARFVDALKKGLFDRHKSFLSNPLLLSIMLLTYHDTAEIPTKLTVFYNQAYESLFQKHDALKGGFQRERRTSLDIQDFAKVFSAFCVRLYDKREFNFSRTRALDILDRGKALTQLEYESSDFLLDAIQAVCLLVEEGVDIAFAHRSFQEYFTARFIALAPPQMKAQLIQRFSPVRGDVVMALLYELDQYAVEQHYILPGLQKLKESIRFKRVVGKTHHLGYVQRLIDHFSMAGGDGQVGAMIRDMQLWELMRFVHSRYCSPHMSYDQRGDMLEELYEAEFGDSEEVRTKSLTLNSPFLAEVREHAHTWSIRYLREVIAAETVILKKHSEVKSSLDDILN